MKWFSRKPKIICGKGEHDHGGIPCGQCVPPGFKGQILVGGARLPPTPVVRRNPDAGPTDPFPTLAERQQASQVAMQGFRAATARMTEPDGWSSRMIRWRMMAQQVGRGDVAVIRFLLSDEALNEFAEPLRTPE